MKRSILLFSTCLFFIGAVAQTDSMKCAQEINQQVWKPFTEHLTSGNKEAFKKLHSKRITRVQIDRGIVQDYEKYFPPEKENNNGSKKRNWVFELRFDKRICNAAKAWETGYYKGTIMEEGKDKRYYYGRFFVVLEKEDGIWKIIVDADTGKNATEENFNAASSME